MMTIKDFTNLFPASLNTKANMPELVDDDDRVRASHVNRLVDAQLEVEALIGDDSLPVGSLRKKVADLEIAVSTVGGSLDDSYDQGSTITADSGAVTINADDNAALKLSSANGIGTDEAFQEIVYTQTADNKPAKKYTHDFSSKGGAVVEYEAASSGPGAIANQCLTKGTLTKNIATEVYVAGGVTGKIFRYVGGVWSEISHGLTFGKVVDMQGTCQNLWALDENGVVIRSQDGGLTWADMSYVSAGYTARSLLVLSATEVYVKEWDTGDWTQEDHAIVKYTGSGWVTKFDGKLNTGWAGGSSKPLCTDGNGLFAFITSDYIYYSDDSGWSDNTPNNVTFSSDNSWYPVDDNPYHSALALVYDSYNSEFVALWKQDSYGIYPEGILINRGTPGVSWGTPSFILHIDTFHTVPRILYASPNSGKLIFAASTSGPWIYLYPDFENNPGTVYSEYNPTSGYADEVMIGYVVDDNIRVTDGRALYYNGSTFVEDGTGITESVRTIVGLKLDVESIGHEIGFVDGSNPDVPAVAYRGKAGVDYIVKGDTGAIQLAAQSDPPEVTGYASIYPKDVSGVTEWFARDDAGNIIQLTDGGSVAGGGAHDLGGAEHNADTLANLNAKISDATLDTNTAERPPSDHAGDHISDGGTDVIAVATTGSTGLCPQLGGGTTNFLRADGSWAEPPGSGGSSTLEGLTDTPVGYGSDGQVLKTNGSDVFTFGGHDDISGSGTNSHSQIDTHLGAASPHSGHEVTSDKNSANGYAGLDASSKLTGSQQVYGSSADTACEGNDSRLSDARTPTSHGSSHVSTDAVPTFNSSTVGLTPASGGGTTNFLRADATWAEPPGGGGAHDLGGAEHNADTLANLNAKISDATLDDSSASRPPTVHDLSGSDHNSSTLAALNAKISDANLDADTAERPPSDHAGDHISDGGTDVIANFTSASSGLAPASGGGTTNFLRADATWAEPPGSGGSSTLEGLTDTPTGYGSNGQVLKTNGSDAFTFDTLDSSDVGLGNVTNDAQLKRADNDWSGFTEESSPGSADIILLEKVTTGAKRKVQVSNLPGGGGGGATPHEEVWTSPGTDSPGDIIVFKGTGTALNATPRGSGTADTESGYDLQMFCNGIKMTHNNPPTSTDEYYYDSANNEVDLYASGDKDRYQAVYGS